VPAQITHDDVAGQLGELYSNTTTSRHTNNWAVLVCASRYWFNYRVSSIVIIVSFCKILTGSTWQTH
jgi:glycosylphosphatidylinositol transamidase (GPIT) subunit GPI8